MAVGHYGREPVRLPVSGIGALKGLVSGLGDLTGMGSITTAITDLAKQAIAATVGDKAAREAAQAELDRMQLAGQTEELVRAHELLKGQQRINEIEAGSQDKFVSRWRPAAGWVAVIALALTYWPKAIVMTGIWTYQAIHAIANTYDVADVVVQPFPDLGVTDLVGLLVTMLGIGGMRSWDKARGLSR